MVLLTHPFTTYQTAKAALKLLYSGEFIPASEALQHGFVSHVVADAELDSFTKRYAETLGSRAFGPLISGKWAYHRHANMKDDDEAYAFASAVMVSQQVWS